MNRHHENVCSGFTLVEVVVAMAILAVSLGVMLRMFSNDLSRASQIEAEVVASSLAQTLLARAGIDQPLLNGETTGQFNNGFRWRMRVAPYGDGQDDATVAPVVARQLSAIVSWQDGGVERSVSLATLRLAPRGAGE
jgi:general secretion pathway protein I